MLGKLTKARLKPIQKLYFLRAHLIPTVTHRLIHERFIGRTLEEIDLAVRKAAKEFLHQVDGIPNFFLHLKVRNGGLGIVQHRWFIPALAFKRMARLKYSTCKMVQYLISTPEYLSEMTRICILAPNKLDYKLRLLNEVTTNPANRGHLCFSIGESIVNRHFTGWTGISGRNLVSLIRLRSGTLGSIYGAPNQPTCHRCLLEIPESLAHILNHCNKMDGMYTIRHDKVRDMIYNTLVGKGWNVLREYRIPVSRTRHVKPDLFAIMPDESTAFCFDVRISYEFNKDTLPSRDTEKRSKYQQFDRSIQDYVRLFFPNVHKVEYYDLIFGSREAIHSVTLNLLKNANFSDLRIGAIVDLIGYESLRIYKTFHLSETSDEL